MSKTVYEWALEAVTADEHNDILDIHRTADISDFSKAQLNLAMTGDCWMSADDHPQQMFYRLALVRDVREGGDDYDDLISRDYAYMTADGTLAQGDDTGFTAPIRYRRALAACINA